MASEETKSWALSQAIFIVSKAAEGGYNKQCLYVELEDLYNSIIKLSDNSKQSD
jgi:hypothetical protein